MKKIFIALAAIATLMLASCVREMPENGEISAISDNVLAFTIKGTVGTRSAEADGPVLGSVIPLGETSNGERFCLQEIVTRMDSFYDGAPATRGTPAYTSNAADLYGSFKGLAYPLGEITASTTPSIPDGVFTYDSENGYWSRFFGGDPLGEAEHYLFLRMPGDQPGVDDLSYSYDTSTSKGKIEFSYATPDSASLQRDILFAGRPAKRADFSPTAPAPVLFHHALTGVKFATANHISGLDEGTKTYITKVEFEGLYGEGTCTVTPIQEGGSYTDDATIFSSKEAVVWKDLAIVDGKVYAQEFTPDHYDRNVYKNHYDYETSGATNDGYFPDSFYANGIKDKEGNLHPTTYWNINDEDASLTFWFIPQAISSTVKMRVTFYVQAGSRTGESITREVDFGEALSAANVEWKAGELRTYVLKALDVAVTVEDVMESETVKKDVVIRNTGNVPEWVRATIVANWCIYQAPDGHYVSDTEYQTLTDPEKDALESIAVYGYTSGDSSDDTFMTPWYLEVETSASPMYGTFYKEWNDTTGAKTAGFPGDGWVKGTDGFYYYPQYIGVDRAATKPLFRGYIVNEAAKPTIYMLDRSTLVRTRVDVHLEMDVVVQAILASYVNQEQQQPEVNKTECNKDWNSALGYNPIP